jgi:hypothetical protein
MEEEGLLIQNGMRSKAARPGGFYLTEDGGIA